MCPLQLKELCRSAIRVLLRANAEIENPLLEDKEKKLASFRRKKSKQRIRKIVVPPPDGRPDSFGSQWFSETNGEDLIDINAVRHVTDDRPDFSAISRQLQSGLSETQRRQERMCSEHNVSLNDCGCDIDKEINESRDADENSEAIKPDYGRRASLLDGADEIACSSRGNVKPNAQFREMPCKCRPTAKPRSSQGNENLCSRQENENPCSSRYDDNSDSTEDHKCEEASADNCLNSRISRFEMKRLIARSRLTRNLMAQALEARKTSEPSEILTLQPSETDRTLTDERGNRTLDAEITDEGFSDTKTSRILTDAGKGNASTSNDTATVGNRMVVAAPSENPTVADDSKVLESEEKHNLGAHGTDNGIYSGDDNGIDRRNSGMSCSNQDKAKRKNGLAGHRRATVFKTTFFKRSAEENDGEGSHLRVRRIRTVSRINAEYYRRLHPEEFRSTFGIDPEEFKRTFGMNIFDDFDCDSDSEIESYRRDYLSCYTYRMTEKISMLPLPSYLKMYLNFSRPI